MALCQAADVMVFLDGQKITVVDGTAGTGQISDDAQQTSVEATILSYLSAKIDPFTLSQWTANSAPAVIKTIAGRMVASLIYRKLYSQDKAQPPAYAMALWAEAMAMLHDVICGNITLYDMTGTPIVDTEHITEANFQPNNTYPASKRVPVIANPDTTQNDYAFGMGGIF